MRHENIVYQKFFKTNTSNLNIHSNIGYMGYILFLEFCI